ncbi:MAG: YdcF family protein [Terriglobales bacterium]
MRVLILRLVAVVAALVLLANLGRFLVIDQPRPSDVIVVLAGETDKRPARGLDLLRQRLAKRLILDVPADAKVFQWSELDLAQRYIQTLPEAPSITVCPIYGLSTKAEGNDVSRCLKDTGARHVLLVTSDYHTRRALSTFKSTVQGYDYSVAAVYDPQEFGTEWWHHREWAKTCFYEWMRLVWWETVDRWF